MTARTKLGPSLAAALLAPATPAAAASGGLNIFPDAGILWLLVGFVLLIPIVNRVVFKPLFAVLDEREARIAGAQKKAAEVGARADEVFEKYEVAVTAARKEAEGIRRETLDDGRREHAQVMSGARRDAERKVAEVRSQVAQSAGEARAAIQGEAETLAREVASQVLGRVIS